MNEEIKEILDKLKSLVYDDYCLEFSVDYIERKEEKILLDYVTNLQQAIKDTKDTADDMLFELKQQITQLTNNWNELEKLIYYIRDNIRSQLDKWLVYEIDDKMKEIKGGNNV